MFALEDKKKAVSIAHPDLVKQWHPTKNGDLKPDKVTAGSDLEVWWVCDQGHEWLAVVRSRCVGVECPYCSGRIPSEDYNLKVINPAVAKEWHPTKNGDLTPNNILPFSTKIVWWVCENGHEWQAPVARRNHSNCPHCHRERLAGSKKN
ncbi:MAG: zinc-ribbon domain-containing protein [bacterium]|nr:zinc-ribbon domain-containing protein [bacterium]